MIEYTHDEAIRRAEAENATFASEGWQSISSSLEEVIQTLDTVNGVDDEKDLWYRRGLIEGLKQVLTRPVLVEQILRQAQEAEQDA